MNLLDIVILATMLFFVIRGLLRGFFREIGSLAGVILGIWFAALFYPRVGDYARSFFPSLEIHTAQLIGFCAIFLFILISCNLVGLSLKILARKTSLGWADRLLGGGLAVVKGIILAYLVIILLTFFVPGQSPLIGQSRLAPFIIRSYQSMLILITPATYEAWKGKFVGQGKGAEKPTSKRIQGTSR